MRGAALFAAVLASAAALPACVGGGGGAAGGRSQPVDGILFMNKTDVYLTFVYLVPHPNVDETVTTVPGDRVVVGLQPFGSEAAEPIPHEGNCTVAPLVARLRDGTEVERLPSGICWDPTYRWVVRQEDLTD